MELLWIRSRHNNILPGQQKLAISNVTQLCSSPVFTAFALVLDDTWDYLINCVTASFYLVVFRVWPAVFDK
jgi:hypothetical protein